MEIILGLATGCGTGEERLAQRESVKNQQKEQTIVYSGIHPGVKEKEELETM